MSETIYFGSKDDIFLLSLFALAVVFLALTDHTEISILFIVAYMFVRGMQ